jgi:hypothetical protein
VTGWRASYDEDWVLTWTAIWVTEQVRDERIFDTKHKAILNVERRAVTQNKNLILTGIASQE